MNNLQWYLRYRNVALSLRSVIRMDHVAIGQGATTQGSLYIDFSRQLTAPVPIIRTKANSLALEG